MIVAVCRGTPLLTVVHTISLGGSPWSGVSFWQPWQEEGPEMLRRAPEQLFGLFCGCPLTSGLARKEKYKFC